MYGWRRQSGVCDERRICTYEVPIYHPDRPMGLPVPRVQAGQRGAGEHFAIV